MSFGVDGKAGTKFTTAPILPYIYGHSFSLCEVGAMGELKHYNPKEMLGHFQEFKYSAAVAHGDLLFCSGVIGLIARRHYPGRSRDPVYTGL
jgi:enamine deaminase RidA (YjgF/YER057c/UK114 family)